MTTIGKVSNIWRFPVKSMAGEQLDSVQVDQGGFFGDRLWALRDVETDKLVSAKRPRLWQNLLNCSASGVGDETVVRLPDGNEYSITDSRLEGLLSEMFGREVKVERAERAHQGLYASDWPEIEGIPLSGEIDIPTNLGGDGIAFVDVATLHIITTASLSRLGELVPDQGTDIRRFRPSFVIETDGLEGFVENDWDGRTMRIGDIEIALGEATPRCVMTTLPQADLPREPEVLQQMAKNNRTTTKLGTFASLGLYASVSAPGLLSVGDPVTLV